MFSKEHPIATVITAGLICGTIIYVANIALICTGLLSADKNIVIEHLVNAKE